MRCAHLKFLTLQMTCLLSISIYFFDASFCRITASYRVIIYLPFEILDQIQQEESCNITLLSRKAQNVSRQSVEGKLSTL